MHPSNPPPLNTSLPSVPPSKRTSVIFEPYALYMISSIIRDLQFLCQQGYISFSALEEIIERLPKPVVQTTPHTPHTPPAPSPSSSPIPQPESPAVSTKSDSSQKRNSNTSITQGPPSTSSQISQQQQQQEEEEEEQQPSHSLAQSRSITEGENQNQQSQQTSIHQQSPIATPPPLQNSSPQSQLQQNDDIVNAGQSQFESIPKPAVPSRASVYQPISPPQSSSNLSSGSSGTISGTGAILATRPLPLPPNASNSSPPRPQPLPVFDNKYEEAEYEKSINQQPQLKDTALPAYSLSIVEALWDFNGDDIGDLSFRKGEIVEVVEYVNMDWWRGRIQGTSNIGIFPKIYTKILNTLNHAIPDQQAANNVANNTAYYTQRLPQHSNTLSSYPSQHYQLSQSPSQLPSQLQHQQLPTQQQLTQTQQSTYTTYQHHPQSVQPGYDPVYVSHASNIASQHHYLNTRNSTNSLNNQQQYFR